MKLPDTLLIAASFTQIVLAQYEPQFQWSTNHTSLLDTILSRGYLRVGTTGDYKPFSYLLTNSTVFPSSNNTNTTLTPSSFNTSSIGADIDLSLRLSNALNLPSPPQLIPTTWSTLSSDLSSGKFDIGMSGISITLLRAQKFYFSTPIQRAGKVAAIKCEDVSRFGSLEDIDQEGVIVVVNPGGTNEKFDRANLEKAEISLVEDNNAVYEAVLGGEGDVMISDVVEVELQMKLHPGKLCMVTGSDGLPFDFSELGYMMPRDDAWKSFVDLFVGIELGNGSWNATLTKWMDFQWPTV